MKKRDPDRQYAYNLRAKFGITPDQHAALHAAQGGACLLCSKKISLRADREDTSQAARMAVGHIDHCHRTGKVRGLLCAHCNHGVGSFFDRPDLLRRAAAYVELHST